MKKTIREDYRIEITPATWRDGLSHEQMRELLVELEKSVRRHVDGLDGVTQRWTTRYECSHCGLEWEVLTAWQAKGERYRQDEHSAEGEPVCCDKAIAEFRAERGLPLLDEDVVAYRNPDRPDVLLCREHGMGWAGLRPLTSEDLPDGGICTYGRPSESECGRDVLAETGGAS